jgi:type II secretory pathway pseudopilin PulG
VHLVQQERSAQLESDVSPYEQRFSRIVASIMVVLALAIATGLSAWVGQQRHSSNSGQQVAFKVIDAAQRDLQPSEALSALKNAAEQRVFHTNRSTSDFWVLIDTTQAGSHQSREFVVELSSKHGTKTECWPLASGASPEHFPTGRDAAPIPARRSKAGYAIEFGATNEPPGNLLCRTNFSGPARPTVMLWSVENYQDAEENFNRAGGLLFGALLH